MRYISLILLIGYSAFAFGGATGYIQEGKTVYLYKDGVAVENKSADQNKISRAPASVSTGMVLFFTEDEVARCYYWAPKVGSNPGKNIHCLKKSDLK